MERKAYKANKNLEEFRNLSSQIFEILQPNKPDRFRNLHLTFIIICEICLPCEMFTP